MLPLLVPFVQPNGTPWAALAYWRADMDHVLERNRGRITRLRQLTNRSEAERNDAELSPYVESLRRRLAEAYEL